MKAIRLIRGGLVIAALVVFMALFVWPPTRPIVSKQFFATVLPLRALNRILPRWAQPCCSTAPLPKNSTEANIARQHPNDYPLQLAATLENVDVMKAQESINQLLPLLRRFPDNPAVPATIIRYGCMGGVSEAIDQYNLNERQKRHLSQWEAKLHLQPNSAERVKDFETLSLRNLVYLRAGCAIRFRRVNPHGLG